MSTPTTTDIQIATDTNFNTLSINETKPYCTTRTFTPTDELPRGVDLYMRVRHHTDDASMDTPWSNTRQFQIESDAKIIGVCMDHSDTTKAPVWDWIDKDGNKVDTFDSTTYPVYANAEGVTITDSDNKTANFIKIPKFYVKTMASGPVNTFAQGKKCWWMADKPSNGFRVHPAFYRKDDGTAADYVSICVNTADINADAKRLFDIYDFGLCNLLICIQSKKTIMEVGSMGPSFPNVDLGIKYISWDFNTIVAGNYYYSNDTDISESTLSIKKVMQLIDSPIPKISSDKLSITKSGSGGKTYIRLDNINNVALKLESNNEISRDYSVGNLKSGSVLIGNITIELMDLFIPDLSLPGTESNCLYSCDDFKVFNEMARPRNNPFISSPIVLMFSSDHSSWNMQFTPLWLDKSTSEGDHPVYLGYLGYVRFFGEYDFRVCLK